MLADATALEGGFSRPVLDTQSTFRAIMDAMARPTRAVAVQAPIAPPLPLDPAAGAIACTLIDADTPFWLDATLSDRQYLQDWLIFHTGARLASTQAEAAFALIGAPAAMPPFDQFAQGSQEYPDRSATLILQVESLDGGAPLTCEGPGIKGRATIAPRGLPTEFARQWGDNRKRFPRGIDLMLTCGNSIICLPRTTRLVRTEG